MGWSRNSSRNGPGSGGASSLLLSAEGATPILVEEHAPSVPGADTIAEYLDETRGLGMGERRLMPEDPSAASKCAG